jgi:hypothetical protein
MSQSAVLQAVGCKEFAKWAAWFNNAQAKGKTRWGWGNGVLLNMSDRVRDRILILHLHTKVSVDILWPLYLCTSCLSANTPISSPISPSYDGS